MTANSPHSTMWKGSLKRIWNVLPWRELRYATRALLHAKGFAITAILAIGLGIGASTTVFEVVYCVLLKPLPYVDSSRLVSIWMKPPDGSQQPVNTGLQPTSSARRMTGWQGLLDHGRNVPELSAADFLDIRNRVKAFSSVAAAEPFSYTLTNIANPITLHAFRVTGNFFSVAYLKPLLGRPLIPSDNQPTGEAHVAVLSASAWRKYFNANQDIIGKEIHLNNEAYQVVGVMPATYHLPVGGYYTNVDLWTPMSETGESFDDRQSAYWPVIARLTPGASLGQAQVQLSSLGTTLAQLHPDTNQTRGFRAIPLRQVLVGTLRPPLILLFAATLTLFTIACVNTASLVTVRTLNRQREVDIRRALGADANALIVQLLAELLLVAFASATLGILLARVAIPLLVALNPMETPLFSDLRLGFVGVLFAAGLALMSLAASGFKPIQVLLHSIKADQLRLMSQRSGETKSNRTTRETFIVGQIALSVMLLVGAGLLIRSLSSLLSIDPGFRTSRIVAAQVTLYGVTRTDDQTQQLVNHIMSRLRTLPGVINVAAISNLPLQETPIDYRSPISLENEQHAGAADRIPVLHTIVTNDYFKTMGVALIRGRTFDNSDTQQSPRTAIISQTLGRLYLGNGNPVGTHIRLGYPVNGSALVIGVVGDVKHARPGAPAEPEVYVSQSQVPSRLLTFVSRTTSEDSELESNVRAVLRNALPNSPLGMIDTMENLRTGVVRPEIFNTTILNVVALLALALALMGIFSSLHYAVAIQRKDIAVKMALGAQRSTIAGDLLKRSATLTLIGLAGGVGISLLLTRFIASMLFGVAPTDPFTYGAIALLIFCTALWASAIPAYLASRTDPLSLLRID